MCAPTVTAGLGPKAERSRLQESSFSVQAACVATFRMRVIGTDTRHTRQWYPAEFASNALHRRLMRTDHLPFQRAPLRCSAVWRRNAPAIPLFWPQTRR